MITLVIISGHDSKQYIKIVYACASLCPTYVIIAFTPKKTKNVNQAFLLVPSKNLAFCTVWHLFWVGEIDVSRLFGVSPVSNRQRSHLKSSKQKLIMDGNRNHCVSSDNVAHDCCRLWSLLQWMVKRLQIFD